MNDFETIKRQYKIEHLIQTETGGSLKPVGSSLGLSSCPFCGHKDCFRVFPATQSYKCFSCGSGGDIFSFVAERRGIADKYEILKTTAGIVGYTLTNSDNIKLESPVTKLRQEIFNKAAKIYHNNLLKDKKALKILSETRSFSVKTIEKFKIGYSGNRANLLLNALKNDYPEDELLKTGLFKKRKETIGDFFVSKLFIYPHLKGNKVVDFSIKDAFKQDKAKDKVIDYRLSNDYRLTDEKIYNADALYYDKIFIVEGREDAIQLMRQIGKPNAVAITGNPSKPDLEIISKYAIDKTVYLCFDNDDAGRNYFKQFFILLWGVAGQIRKITWDGPEKDIDEFIRARKTKVKDEIEKLIDSAPEALSVYIKSIQDGGDISRTVNDLNPLVEKMLLSDEPIQFDIALEHIKDHFSKGAAIAKILQKKYEKARLEQMNGKDYLKNLPFFEKEGVYYHKKTNGTVNISNFRLHIKDRIFYDDQTFYRCDIHSVNGESAENVEFSPAERVDSRKFRTKLASVGAFHFTGRDNELSGVWQYEEAKGDNRHIHYIKQYGYIRKENIWLFDNCAFKDGQIYERDAETDFIQIGKKFYLPHNVLVYSGAKPKINIKREYRPDFANKVAESFHKMLDSLPNGRVNSYAGYLFLGFLPATIYSNEIFEKYGYFPFLFSYGPPGTGKTHATRLLLNTFGFMAQPESWDSATVAGTYQFIQQVSALPCWYDEFLNDKTFDRLLGTVKNIYNKTGAGKGGKEEIRTLREVNGTLWLSGEDNPANEAVLSRSILFRFGNLNVHKNKAYNWLLDNSKNLSVLTKALLLEKNEDNARELIRRIDTYQEYMIQHSERIDPRVAGNHAIIAAGLSLLDIDLPEEFDSYLVKHAEKNTFFKEEENPRHVFFEELGFLYQKGLLYQSVKFEERENILYVHFESVIREIQSDMRRRGQQIKIKSHSIMDYLRDMPGYLKKERVYFKAGEKNIQKRAMAFSYNRLPQKIKGIIDDII